MPKKLTRNEVCDYLNNINLELIRIPYWEFNNIEDILKEKLSNLK